MFAHECIVGLLHLTDCDVLVTLQGLKNHIEDTRNYNDMLRFDPSFKSEFQRLKHEEYSLAQYGDRRRATNLSRFSFCPLCGEEIDWAAIRRNGNA